MERQTDQSPDVAQIANAVTPIVASLVQSRAYQAGYTMPRAA